MTDQTFTFPPDVSWEQFDRYVANECVPSERAMLAQRLIQLEDVAVVVTAAQASARLDISTTQDIVRRVMATVYEAQLDVHTEAVVCKDRDTCVPQRRNGYVSGPNQFQRSGILRWIRGHIPVLSVCVLVTIAMLGVVQDRFFPLDTSSNTLKFITANAQQTTLSLPDGSQVTLNAASWIDIPKDFGITTRSIRLYGEAHFLVAHTLGNPFVVVTESSKTRVLGTEFSVRAYDPNTVRVAVREGRVALNTTVLDASDIGYTSADGTVAVARNQNIESVIGFTAGELVLNSMSLYDAIPDLNRWYDADIQLDDPSMRLLRIDAVLRKGTTEDLAEMLRKTFNVFVTRNGRTLHMHGPKE